MSDSAPDSLELGDLVRRRHPGHQRNLSTKRRPTRLPHHRPDLPSPSRRGHRPSRPSIPCACRQPIRAGPRATTNPASGRSDPFACNRCRRPSRRFRDQWCSARRSGPSARPGHGGRSCPGRNPRRQKHCRESQGAELPNFPLSARPAVAPTSSRTTAPAAASKITMPRDRCSSGDPANPGCRWRPEQTGRKS